MHRNNKSASRKMEYHLLCMLSSLKSSKARETQWRTFSRACTRENMQIKVKVSINMYKNAAL